MVSIARHKRAMGRTLRDARLPLSANTDSRRTLRKAVKLTARLRDRGTTGFKIDVVDLSITGFRAETSFTLHPGNIVWLKLPGLTALEAEIAWREGTRVGARFHQPLHPAVFDHIVRLAQRAEVAAARRLSALA